MKANIAPQNLKIDQPAGQATLRPHSAAGLRSLQEERDYHKRRLAFETMPAEAYSGQGPAGLSIDQDDSSAFTMKVDGQRPDWSQ